MNCFYDNKTNKAEHISEVQSESFQLHKNIKTLYDEIDDLKCCANCTHSSPLKSCCICDYIYPEDVWFAHESILYNQIMELIEKHFTDNAGLTEITTDDNVKFTLKSHYDDSIWPISYITISRGQATYAMFLK